MAALTFEQKLATFDRLQISGAVDQRKLVRWLVGSAAAKSIASNPNVKATILGLITESFVVVDEEGNTQLNVDILRDKMVNLVEGR
jgi:hypothetical protein